MGPVLDLAKSARDRELNAAGERYSRIADDLFKTLAKEKLNPVQITQFLAITQQLWATKVNAFLVEQPPEMIIS